METQPTGFRQKFSAFRILLPILIGFGISFWLISNSLSKTPDLLQQADFGGFVVAMLLLAVLMLLLRDLFLIYRIRVLTEGKLTWLKCAETQTLWTFASAVTPFIVGGTAFGFFLLSKAGIRTGRTTAIILVTAFLDELYFVLMVPALYLIVGQDKIFDFYYSAGGEGTGWVEMGLVTVCLLGYGLVTLYTLGLGIGLFVKPQWIARLLQWLFKLPLIRRWKEKGAEAGEEIITAAKELSRKSGGFWAKAVGSTILSWTARFLIVNCVLIAFGSGVVLEHGLILARQIFMWIILMIAPSPGGSGVAEIAFGEFLAEYCREGFAPALAFVWRLIAYYPYLILGAFLFPRWLLRQGVKKEQAGD